MDSNPRSPVTGPKLIRDCRRVTSASLATGRYSRPRICRCIGASTHGAPGHRARYGSCGGSLRASTDSRRRPAVPTVGDSRHGRFCLSRPGGIARTNPRCYAISVERKQNIAATARAIDVLLEGLNPAQRSAATYGIDAEQEPPPLLIAAGAGTGKTKTLAHRVARLILGGADPRRLLLLTFTRRAALEMTRRAQQILGASQRGRAAGGAEAALLPWSGTFHSLPPCNAMSDSGTPTWT